MNHLSEEDTKTKYINPCLRKKGWHDGLNVKMEYPDKPLTYTEGRINSFTGKREPDTKRGKQLDYLLYLHNDLNHKLAVIEAKKLSKSVDYGMSQGISYAHDLNIPFVFSSNGRGFDFHDCLISKEKLIPSKDFPTEQQLFERYVKEAHLGQDGIQLMKSKYYHRSDGNPSRYYQVNAINKTLEAIVHGKKHIMFVLATGTGKTYIASQIVYRLLNAKNLKHPINNVLYLVDRKILASQPLSRGGDFYRWNHNGAITLKSKDWKHPRNLTAYTVYFGLYQQLFGHGNKQSYKHFPRDYFDLIIVDEAHRGSDRLDSNWHKILEYFAPTNKSDTIVIGMTATPRETKGANYGYFGKPVYNYSLKQGINDGFLAPYNVIQVEPNIDVKGFTPSKNERDINGHILEHRKYGTRDYDRNLVILNRDVLVARIVSNYLKRHHMRMAKTIFFCNNIPHASRMRRYLIDENSDLYHKYGNYVAQITSGLDVDVAPALHRFEDTDSPCPTLVTTSDMLRTGVNAKDVKVIVLDTKVNSMTEFKQMIGRGTRLDLKRGKSHFLIFDFRDNASKWSDPAFDGDPDTIRKIASQKDMKSLKETQAPTESNSNRSVKQDDSDNSSYVPTLNNVNVKVHDSRTFHFDKNGKPVTDNIVLYTKRNLLGEFPSLSNFLTKWNTSEKKSALFDVLNKKGILDDFKQIYAKHKDLQKYDIFDLIIHLAFDRPPLTKRDRVNHVKKQGVLYKYHGKARDVLESLLEKFQDSNIDVADLEKPNTLNAEDLSRKFGGDVEVVFDDFGGPKKFNTAIHNIINSLYSTEA